MRATPAVAPPSDLTEHPPSAQGKLGTSFIELLVGMVLLGLVASAIATLLAGTGRQLRHDAIRFRMEHLCFDLAEALATLDGAALARLLPSGRLVEGPHAWPLLDRALSAHRQAASGPWGVATIGSRARLQPVSGLPGLDTLTVEISWQLPGLPGSRMRTGRIVRVSS